MPLLTELIEFCRQFYKDNAPCTGLAWDSALAARCAVRAASGGATNWMRVVRW